jgi:hypothetical protein
VDPVLGSVIASFTAGLFALAIAIVNGRNSADRLRLEELVRRLKRRLIDKHGEDPTDVENF